MPEGSDPDEYIKQNGKENFFFLLKEKKIIQTYLWNYYIYKIDKNNPEWDGRDRFILSKGHACLAYYAALSEVGYLSEKELKTFEKDGSILAGHPVKNIKYGDRKSVV